jgi:hypothetical protein
MKPITIKKSLQLLIWPLAVLLLIEGFFRFGFYEPLLKPHSHAHQTKQAKKYETMFSAKQIHAITMGDSRARIGIDHGQLTKAQQHLGINHLNMTMNRSHLTTFTAVTNWANDQFQNLSIVVIAMSKSGLKQVHYGPFELAKIQPLQHWSNGRKTEVYDDVGLKNGLIQHIANWSAMVAYRKDLRDLLKNPLHRFASLQQPQAPQNVYQNIGQPEDVCGINLSSIKACQANTNDEQLNTGRQNVLKRYCLNEHALSIQKLGLPSLSQTEVDRAIRYWSTYLQSLTNQGLTVVMVWLPDHHLLKNELQYVNEHEVFQAISGLINQKPLLYQLDLQDLFDHQSTPACQYFYELIHPNALGTQLITQSVIDFFQDNQRQATD